jgi:hypothetical protein
LLENTYKILVATCPSVAEIPLFLPFLLHCPLFSSVQPIEFKRFLISPPASLELLYKSPGLF